MSKQIKSIILTWLNKLTPIVDIFVFAYIFRYFNEREESSSKILAYAALFGIGFVIYRWVKAFWIVHKSKNEGYYYLLSNRVIPICGKQRVGKSSLASYFASLADGDIYSNIPLRIRGKYTNKLTTDILTCRKQIDDGSCLVIDEANLFYNNIHSEIDDDNIFGQAVLCQCVGHFFDGNIMYVAVDTDRIPKQLRACYSAQLQVTGSKPYRYSLLGDLLLKVLVKILLREQRVFTGLRVWKAQHYEKIKEEQYTSLLGDKENEFSPMLTFAMWQNFGLSMYDDRYMKAYYKDKPHAPIAKWDSLIINKEDFKNLYDSVFLNYLNNLNKEEEKKKTVRIIDNTNTE